MNSVRLKSYVWNKQTFFQVCIHRSLFSSTLASLVTKKTFCIMFLSHCLIFSCHLTEYFSYGSCSFKMLHKFSQNTWLGDSFIIITGVEQAIITHLWILIFIFSHNNLQESSSNFLTYVPVLSFTIKSTSPYINRGHSSR